MSEQEPIAEPLLEGDERPQPAGAEGRDRLAAAGTCWLATTDADGAPHVRPLLAIWLDGPDGMDGALHFAAGGATRKARNLARDPRCAVATTVPSLDLTVEGSAAIVRDADTLARAAAVYATKYDWPVEIRDGAFHADGAPTAGPPPYDLYRVTPKRIFSFGTDDSFTATRWRF